VSLSDEDRRVLSEVVGDLRELAERAHEAVPSPDQRAVLSAQFFIVIQKVRFVLGEEG
jgi:hypothetical protein